MERAIAELTRRAEIVENNAPINEAQGTSVNSYLSGWRVAGPKV